jgi:ankyrin repeat protein
MNKPCNRKPQLFAAIQNSDIEQVKELVATSLDLNRKNENGQTPLTLAARIGQPEIVHLLISAGAQVNVEPDSLVFHPQIMGSNPSGGENLQQLITQATSNAPKNVQDFYNSLMSVVESFPSKKS